MIRRGGGRSPPFVLIGLLVVLVILGFNYWLLSSQNADLQQDLEKLQAEIKISAMRQEQSEKKNAALQETIHEMDRISAEMKKKLQDEDYMLENKNHDNQKKDYEITTLKNKIVNLQEEINTIKQQLEDQDIELTKSKETNNHLASERDAAVEAVAEKDALINTLKRQLEQEKSQSSMLQYSMGDLKKKFAQTSSDLSECHNKMSKLEDLARETQDKKVQEELAVHQREQQAMAKPRVVPGAMNIPDIEKKGHQYATGGVDAAAQAAAQVKPPLKEAPSPQLQSPAGRHLVPGYVEQHYQGIAKPRYSLAPKTQTLQQLPLGPIQGPAVVERPAPPVAGNHRPLQPPANVGEMDPQNEVLAPPPPQDNLDTAVDEEEKVADDLMYDQDEEGNEVRRQEEDRAVEEDPGRGGGGARLVGEEGALELPQVYHPGPDDPHQDVNLGDERPNYFDHNLDGNIRSLQRHHKLG